MFIGKGPKSPYPKIERMFEDFMSPNPLPMPPRDGLRLGE